MIFCQKPSKRHKKRHKQHIPSCAIPLPAPASGSRSFPINRDPAPQIRPDADGAQARNAQRRLTAASGGSPLVFEPPFAVLMPGTGPTIHLLSPGSCPEIQYNSIPHPLQREKSVNRHFFPAKTHYFATCTSLLYKFRHENQEPGLSSPILFLKKKRPPS